MLCVVNAEKICGKKNIKKYITEIQVKEENVYSFMYASCGIYTSSKMYGYGFG